MPGLIFNLLATQVDACIGHFICEGGALRICEGGALRLAGKVHARFFKGGSMLKLFLLRIYAIRVDAGAHEVQSSHATCRRQALARRDG